MKYWSGYLTAAVVAFFSWALIKFAQGHSLLIDRVYPYVTRMLQTMLAQWSGGVDFCLWQLLAIILVVGVLASIVVMLVLRGNLVQWCGWVLAVASLVFFLHTAAYGLNSYAGPLAEDIRMDTTEFTLQELEDAAVYYRDKANLLSEQVSRDSSGQVQFYEFETLANQAGEGYQSLVYDRSYAVFAGSVEPVKKLGWADMYTSMQINGFTFSLTGEAAVNPQIPDVKLPFTMCHEMAHRMSIAVERDANFAAFLACQANSSLEFQYSGYFNAYRFCYNALTGLGATEAAKRVSSGVGELLGEDLAYYRSFYIENHDEKATEFATSVNDGYIKINGDDRGVASYGDVSDLLVCWYIQEVVLPQHTEEEVVFDPYDEDWVFATVPTEETTESEANG